MSLAPDGQRLAVDIVDPRRSTSDQWIVDLERNLPTRFTSAIRSEMDPKWSPDGTRLAFSTDWQGPPNVYLADLSGGEPRVIVPFDRMQQYAGGWTPDGTRIVYTTRTEKAGGDLWVVDTTSGERRAILATAFEEWAPTVAPNGSWLAYLSNASGGAEAYLRGFPDGAWQTRISGDGATAVAWRADGRELFYVEPSGAFMAVPIVPGPSGSARAGTPVRLFQIDPRLFRSFEVAPDGQRFLVNIASPDAVFRTDEVVVDWTRLLRR
jgi:Tol biopolymer transport system component